MRSTHEELLKLLRDIDAFVESIGLVERIGRNPSVNADDNSAMLRSLNVRKRFDYAAFIISLYACMERYVEDLVWAYARHQSGRTKYVELPETLQHRNVQRSGELLAKHRLGEGRFERLEPARVVANLHGCLSGTGGYQLTREAIIYHEKNLRPDVLQGLFKGIGVENVHTRARSVDVFESWYRGAKKLDSLPEGGISNEVIRRRLEDLVERRNQVAHGGALSDDLESVEQMSERIRFVEAYCNALFVVTVACTLKSVDTIQVKGVRRMQKLGPNVVVATTPPCRLYVGQPIYGTRAQEVDRLGVIEEIRLDEKPVESLESGSGAVEVGLKVGFPIARETRLHVLANPDDAVWV